LAQVSSSAKATWYQEAFEIFLSGVTPWLDHLSSLSYASVVVDILVKMDHPSGVTMRQARRGGLATSARRIESRLAKANGVAIP